MTARYVLADVATKATYFSLVAAAFIFVSMLLLTGLHPSKGTELRDGTKILVRPVRPEDEPLYGPFFAAVTQQDLRLRFFAPVKEFGHTFIVRFTQIDYARAMAFIALEESSGNMLGVVRLHADANYERGEYAILVRSDLKGRGLGYLLMQMIIEYARAEGLKTVEGQVLAENTAMLAMCRELGFSISPDPSDPDTCVVKLAIRH